MQNSTALRGQWKLAEVAIANAGLDGKVKDVTLHYKNHITGAQYSGQKDVLINRSIHKLVAVLPFEEQTQKNKFILSPFGLLI